VRDRDDRAVERFEPLLERVSRVQVEVVGRLVEQQHRRAAQLEQEDLEPSLLPAGQRVEGLLGRPSELIAVQSPGGFLARFSSSMLVAAVKNLQQGSSQQRGVLMGLGEPARSHA